MAEISEAPNPSQHMPAPEPEFDPKTMRESPPGLKRLFLTFSVLISFLLGFPLLWKSVEIYRSPLPFHDIDTVSNDIASNPFLSPFHFQAIFITSNKNTPNPQDLKLSILSQITKLASQTPHCGTCANNFTLSLTVDSPGTACTQFLQDDDERSCSYKCEAIRAVDLDFQDDKGIDEIFESVFGGNCGRKVYTVVVVDEVGGDFEGLKAVVGKYRHAWIVGKNLGMEMVVQRVAEMFVKVFVNGGTEEGLIHGEFMPVGSDGKIVLSFNLLNANPADWIFDW